MSPTLFSILTKIPDSAQVLGRDWSLTEHVASKKKILMLFSKGSFRYGHKRGHQRVRRQISDSCGAVDQCTGNKTVFRVENTNYCSCDDACFNIFSDCCTDYKRHCGPQKLKNPEPIWRCVEFSWSPIWPCVIEGLTGVWMIYKCPADRPFDELTRKCENAPSEFSYPVENFIPVVGVNNKTFRNKYCALCNGIKNFTTWNVGVSTHVIPPDESDIDMKLKFIENNGGKIDHVSPRAEQPRRYCFGRNYVDNCSSTDPRLVQGCVEGPIEVVTSTTGKYTYYKNFPCALCNGYRDATEWKTAQVCEPVPPEGFSVVFHLQENKPTTNVVRTFCPARTVYDPILKFCRDGYITASSDELNDEFLILLWFKQPKVRSTSQLNSTLKKDLTSALSFHYSLLDSQISKMTFHNQDERNDLLVASLRLTLTAFQTLIIANENATFLNSTRENTAFLKLLNFTGNVTLYWKHYSFAVVKVISKQLSCYGKEKFQWNEYEIGQENGTLVVRRTGQILLLNDYTVFTKIDGNITLCRKVVLADCDEGGYVPLSRNEYEILPNLTVYYNRKFINFGQYLIHETLNKDQNDTSGSVLTKNVTISVCLPLGNTYNQTKTDDNGKKTSIALRYLTSIGFSVSIICLILLLITYALFKELRTIPGLNLMNLSLSMLLSYLVWLIGTSHFTGTEACKILAMFGQYLFQVSFLAMSVISFHSYRAFSQPITGRAANKSWRRLMKYTLFVWVTPAIFVAICIALDKTNTFTIDYGTNCWLGTKNAKLYLFLLPLALLLLFNIYTFIQTALSLSRHEKNRMTLQLREGKQNLLISAKLATLVGFPWLFGFLGIIFPHTEAFEYLFVVFACLQGLYIGIAFVFNKKTLKLYKDRYELLSTGSTSSRTTPTFAMT